MKVTYTIFFRNQRGRIFSYTECSDILILFRVFELFRDHCKKGARFSISMSLLDHSTVNPVTDYKVEDFSVEDFSSLISSIESKKEYLFRKFEMIL